MSPDTCNRQHLRYRESQARAGFFAQFVPTLVELAFVLYSPIPWERDAERALLLAK